MPDRGYWYLIALGIAELDERGFITEHTSDRMRRHDIDPVQVELGWGDVELGLSASTLSSL